MSREPTLMICTSMSKLLSRDWSLTSFSWAAHPLWPRRRECAHLPGEALPWPRPPVRAAQVVDHLPVIQSHHQVLLAALSTAAHPSRPLDLRMRQPPSGILVVTLDNRQVINDLGRSDWTDAAKEALRQGDVHIRVAWPKRMCRP